MAFLFCFCFLLVCLQVIVTPDSYPTETSWDVQYSDLNKVIYSGYHVSVFDTTLVTEECLEVERGRCITITIYDSDGFCCGYGQGKKDTVKIHINLNLLLKKMYIC